MVIGNSVTSIGEHVFSGCNNLRKVAYPNTISDPFSNSVKIEAIIAYPVQSALEDGLVYASDKSALYFVPLDIQGGFEIPNSVTQIGSSAFYGCSGLTSLEIPTSLTEIGYQAFYGCEGLTSIVFNAIDCKTFGSSSNPVFPNSIETLVFGDRVTKIPAYSFLECKKLKSIDISNSVTEIGSSAFANCSGITSIEIPNSVTSIGNQAFSGCVGLNTLIFNAESCKANGSASNPVFPNSIRSLVIGNQVKQIPAYSFYECNKLTTVTIPESVTEIGTSAFYGCSNLNTLKFNAKNCNANGNVSNPVFPKSIKTLILGDEVTKIPAYSFCGCTNLTSVVIPPSITEIGNSAFDGCSNLKKTAYPNAVNNPFPDSVEICISYPVQTILEDGLVYASDKSIIYFVPLNMQGNFKIPESVSLIGDKAFSYCNDLISLEIPTSVSLIGNQAFWGCNSLSSLTFNAIDCNVNGNSNNSIFPNSINTLIIGDEVTKIPANSFSGCKKLVSLVVPDAVTAIGNDSFSGCSGLTSVTVGNSVTSIGSYAFSGCSSVTKLELGSSLQEIGNNAFYRCSGISSVVIPNSVTKIGEYAFSGCGNLNTIIMGYGIKTIEGGVFNNCKGANVYVTAQTPPQIKSDTFSDFSGKLYLQGQNAINEYKSANYWKNFSTEPMIEPAALKIEHIGSVSGGADSVFRLKGNLEPENVTLPYIFWHSTNPQLASVDKDGIVTLHMHEAEGTSGTCNIIAESLYFDGPISEAMVDKTGVNIAEITLSDSKLNLKSGQSAVLTATVKNTMGKTVNWKSSNELVAKVDNNGKVITVAVGEAIITAQCGNISASCTVTVLPVLAESLSLDPTAWSGEIGSEFTIKASVLPDNVTDKTVTWKSSNELVAKVDNNGKVITIAAGEAIITAQCGNISASCTVTVLPVLAESLSLDPTAWSGEIGSEFTIKASVLPDNVTDKTVTFESSDTSIAIVDSYGVVNVLKDGTCKITVSTIDGSNLKAECAITSISGVDTIFDDQDVEVDVYNIYGVLMKRACTPDDLKCLTPNVYILRNGKKVVKTVIR